MTHRPYTQAGWTFWQVRRGSWLLTRDADGYATDHRSLAGCRLFIRDFGSAIDPDAAYERAMDAALAA